MRACSGTWIAHGSGQRRPRSRRRERPRHGAAREPVLHLRRVWLTKEEEDGYYYGFANEGLWPLCHIAHTRPVFRAARLGALPRRSTGGSPMPWRRRPTDADPIVLVQDYHFALLPRMLRELLPKATIVTFWHIPWPNPETFGICPWREELLEGLLGIDHPRVPHPVPLQQLLRHGRPLPRGAASTARRFTISYGGRADRGATLPDLDRVAAAGPASQPPVAECRRGGPRRTGPAAGHAASASASTASTTPRASSSGFAAVERFLELAARMDRALRVRPDRRAQPLAASTSTSRSTHDVRAAAQRINDRFGARGLPADRAQDRAPRRRARSIAYYRAADFCFVSSLHDGMNLVAKEFVAAARGRARRAGAVAASPAPRGNCRRRSSSIRTTPSSARGDSRGADHAAGRAARADAQHARACCRSSTSTAGRAGCCSTPRGCATGAGSRLAPGMGHGRRGTDTRDGKGFRATIDRMQAETDASAAQPGEPGPGVPPPSARVALFLDFDGTLVASRRPSRRGDGRAGPATPWLARLAQARRRPRRWSPAVPSPRSSALRPARASTSRDSMGPNGARRTDLTATPRSPKADEVAALRRPREPGLVVEDKGTTVALHWRMAPQPRGSSARDAARARRLGEGSAADREGRLRDPAVLGRTRARPSPTLHGLAPYRGRVPVFVGATITDEHGFAARDRGRRAGDAGGGGCHPGAAAPRRASRASRRADRLGAHRRLSFRDGVSGAGETPAAGDGPPSRDHKETRR